MEGRMDLKKVLGSNIKHYRQLKGYSQEEFSEMLNISQQTLSRIERGINFLTAETLEKIPHILSVNTYELFMNNEDYTTKRRNSNMNSVFLYLSNTLINIFNSKLQKFLILCRTNNFKNLY